MYLIKVCSLQAETPLAQWGAHGAPPIPDDKGVSSPQHPWAVHWPSSAPSRSECCMVLSTVPSHHCPQRLEASTCLQNNIEPLQVFENQGIILHFLEKCILLHSSDLFQCGSRGVLLPSLFLWKWPGQFGCLQSPRQVTSPGGPGPGGPSFQTLRLTLNVDAPASPSRILISSPSLFRLLFSLRFTWHRHSQFLKSPEISPEGKVLKDSEGQIKNADDSYLSCWCLEGDERVFSHENCKSLPSNRSFGGILCLPAHSNNFVPEF